MHKYETHESWIKVRYSTGGAAPVVTELTVTRQGFLDLLAVNWETHSVLVADHQLTRLRRLLGSPSLKESLRAAHSAGHPPSTSEESVLLTLDRRQYLFPTTHLPAVVRTFLEAIDDLFSRFHGQRYSLRIPH